LGAAPIVTGNGDSTVVAEVTFLGDRPLKHFSVAPACGGREKTVQSTGRLKVGIVCHQVMNRRNLRDTVIIFSLALALFNRVGNWEIAGSVAMLLVGSVLHFISKGVLIRNLVVCKHGIYAVVRHPFYLSNYLVDMSFCLMSGSLLLAVTYPFLFFWSYGPTMRKEERELFLLHGDALLDAFFSIPQVFPDSGTLKAWREILGGFSLRRISKRELARIARFWAVEFLFLLFHDLREEGLGEFISPVDYDGIAFAAACFLLSLTSLSLARLQGRMGEAGSQDRGIHLG